MKIKIISASDDKWYKHLIGKIYCVKKLYDGDHGKFFIIRNYRTLLRTINFNDAEIIN